MPFGERWQAGQQYAKRSASKPAHGGGAVHVKDALVPAPPKQARKTVDEENVHPERKASRSRGCGARYFQQNEAPFRILSTGGACQGLFAEPGCWSFVPRGPANCVPASSTLGTGALPATSSSISLRARACNRPAAAIST